MKISISAPLMALVSAGITSVSGQITWTTQQLTAEFHAEGAACGDFNKDGKKDVAYGPFWWAGPDFKTQKQIYAPSPFDPRGYSKNFVAYGPDLNGDGYDDVLVLGFPGDWSYWFENPRGAEGDWKRHNIFKVTDNESPMWTDITGDGKPELVCSTDGVFGFASPGSDPTKEWPFTGISAPGAAGGRFTHGLGVGDVNGDKKPDLLEKNGWWEQPADTRTQSVWTFHKFEFSGPGGAQMFAGDFDGDGDNDVFTSLAAHAYGLAWYEHTKDDKGGITFVKHDLMSGNKASDDPKRPVYSMLHAIDMKDIDGDGTADFVTGKRHWAHAPKPDGSGGDPGANEPAVIYWYRVMPGGKSGAAEFIPQLIHADSGVGTQVMITDIDGAGTPDILVGNKKGCFVHTGKKG